MSASVALLRMHRAGLVQLPPPRGRRVLPKPIRPTPASDPPALLPPWTCLADVRPLRIAPLRKADPRSRLWNECIERYHYLGPVRAAGCQLRYLLSAEPGLLGGLLFAAATRRQRARDRWIGWTPAQCAAGRHRLLGLARFLLRPAPGSCHNLASKALALCLRRVADDFQAAYGFDPVLVESYVGPPMPVPATVPPAGSGSVTPPGGPATARRFRSRRSICARCACIGGISWECAWRRWSRGRASTARRGPARSSVRRRSATRAWCGGWWLPRKCWRGLRRGPFSPWRADRRR